jgi:hypothetical protein
MKVGAASRRHSDVGGPKKVAKSFSGPSSAADETSRADLNRHRRCGRLAHLPLTFPAHQGFIAPIKLRWPNAIDGTALCIGAAAPDLAYALGDWLNHQSHSAIGVLLFAVPFTLVAAAITRWRAASGIFAVLPDLGPLRLRSYRVLANRRPAFFVTLSSALIGAGSHAIVDGFTHRGRWGADWAGLNEVLFTVPGRGDFSAARVLQYVGHSFGSFAFVVVLFVIASSGRLEHWYGVDAVARARSVTLTTSRRALFWLMVSVPTLAFAFLASDLGLSRIFFPILVLTVSVLLAGVLVAPASTRASPLADSSDAGSTAPHH